MPPKRRLTPTVRDKDNDVVMKITNTPVKKQKQTKTIQIEKAQQDKTTQEQQDKKMKEQQNYFQARTCWLEASSRWLHELQRTQKMCDIHQALINLKVREEASMSASASISGQLLVPSEYLSRINPKYLNPKDFPTFQDIWCKVFLSLTLHYDNTLDVERKIYEYVISKKLLSKEHSPHFVNYLATYECTMNNLQLSTSDKTLLLDLLRKKNEIATPQELSHKNPSIVIMISERTSGMSIEKGLDDNLFTEKGLLQIIFQEVWNSACAFQVSLRQNDKHLQNEFLTHLHKPYTFIYALPSGNKVALHTDWFVQDFDFDRGCAYDPHVPRNDYNDRDQVCAEANICNKVDSRFDILGFLWYLYRQSSFRRSSKYDTIRKWIREQIFGDKFTEHLTQMDAGDIPIPHAHRSGAEYRQLILSSTVQDWSNHKTFGNTLPTALEVLDRVIIFCIRHNVLSLLMDKEIKPDHIIFTCPPRLDFPLSTGLILHDHNIASSNNNNNKYNQVMVPENIFQQMGRAIAQPASKMRKQNDVNIGIEKLDQRKRFIDLISIQYPDYQDSLSKYLSSASNLQLTQQIQRIIKDHTATIDTRAREIMQLRIAKYFKLEYNALSFSQVINIWTQELEILQNTWLPSFSYYNLKSKIHLQYKDLIIFTQGNTEIMDTQNIIIWQAITLIACPIWYTILPSLRNSILKALGRDVYNIYIDIYQRCDLAKYSIPVLNTLT